MNQDPEVIQNEQPDIEPVETLIEEAPAVIEPQAIPYDRFSEVVAQKAAAEQQLSLMQQQMWQMAQMVQRQQQQQANYPPPPDPIDPEVAKLVSPVVQQYVGPLQAEVHRLHQQNAELRAQTEAQQAWNYVERSVPDLNDLQADLVIYIQQQPAEVQQAVSKDPNLMVFMANQVRTLKQAGILGNQAQQALKSRARTATGQFAPVPQQTPSNTPVDYMSLSPEEWERKRSQIQAERAKRGY
jgi:hypothetical protein